jgi:hypothetical protein
MSPTNLTTRPAPTRPHAPQLAVALAVIVAAVAFVFVVSRATAVPGTVDRVVIANDTDYGLDVDLRAGDGDSRLLLGRALPQRDTQRREVIDAGDRWRFSFRSGGEVVGDVEMTRGELEAAGWEVAVPDAVAQALDASPRSAYPDEGTR